jgi:uncharacterized metal-binding protein YceD (DUF177 family)
MTPESVGPLSRPVSADNLPAEGTTVSVVATAEERAALAQDFRLPAIHSLTGEFRLTGSRSRIRVMGRITADISQTCVVTLEPFDTTVSEEVEVDFTSGGRRPMEEAAEGADAELADPIVGGHIDLGALTAEFLALGLDPYPRKPGVAFSYEDRAGEPDSPFAALKGLKPGG